MPSDRRIQPPFVTVDDLQEYDGTDTELVIADVRWYLDGRRGRDEFDKGHVPGAVFVDVDTDLSTPGAPTDGRHPLPDTTDFARAMGRLGIGDETYVVAYDDTGGMTASRLVVMLRMLGHRASLLDGGLDAWRAARPDDIEVGPPKRRDSSYFTARPWPTERLASVDDVASTRERRSVLLDARSPERFRGDVAAVDPRPGHVPGAFNAPWSSVLDNGRIKPIAALRAHYRALGVESSDDVVAYCGSGVSACLNVLAMERAGFAPPRLYVASWSGW